MDSFFQEWKTPIVDCMICYETFPSLEHLYLYFKVRIHVNYDSHMSTCLSTQKDTVGIFNVFSENHKGSLKSLDVLKQVYRL
jgi:hypothetical protein